jgi:magnesium transporter
VLEVAQPADVAEILADLESGQQLLILRCLDGETRAEVIGEADERVQKDLLLNLLTRGEIAGILNEMAPDDGADLVGLLPEEEREEALTDVEPEQAEDIRTLATFDPETAGGIMTTEYVTVSPDLSVHDALETLRTSLDLESISNLYAVDDGEKLVGVLSVRDILEADPETIVGDVMVAEVVSARLDDDQEDASRLLDRYDFASLPVVDDAGLLQGVITIDDAMDVLEEEAEEDIALIAGSGLVTVRDPLLTHLRVRLPWLGLTLLGGFVAALLLRYFEPTLHEVTTLVFFMPVMVGMAGSVGIQSSTVLVRGFATGEMEMDMAVRTMFGQMGLGLLLGMLCGVVTGVLALSLAEQDGMRVGVAVAISMAAGITVAAVMGTLLPIACEKFGIDPAVASGPFITTMNDILGLLIYFTVATVILLNGTS